MRGRVRDERQRRASVSADSGIGDALMATMRLPSTSLGAAPRGFSRIGLEVHAAPSWLNEAGRWRLLHRQRFEASGVEGRPSTEDDARCVERAGADVSRRSGLRPRGRRTRAESQVRLPLRLRRDAPVHDPVLRAVTSAREPARAGLVSRRLHRAAAGPVRRRDLRRGLCRGDRRGEAAARQPRGLRERSGRFEDCRLPARYDNIVLTHVLEHLDDPVGILRRVGDEWLPTPGGSFSCARTPTPRRARSR